MCATGGGRSPRARGLCCRASCCESSRQQANPCVRHPSRRSVTPASPHKHRRKSTPRFSARQGLWRLPLLRTNEYCRVLFYIRLHVEFHWRSFLSVLILTITLWSSPCDTNSARSASTTQEPILCQDMFIDT